MKSALELYGSPDFYPLKMDFDHGRLSFVPMSRAAYKSSSFLDLRTLAAGGERYETTLEELIHANGQLPTAPNLVHYIFHAAFCCSTLLARYLEMIPRCFVLKEPLYLTQLAVVRPRSILTHNDGELEPAEWICQLDLCVRLLGRGYAAEDIVAIKVNDICNSLGEMLLARDPTSHAVFVTIGLKDFLLVLLKDANRRQWLRGRLVRARNDSAMVPELAEIDPAKMSDAEGGAYLWALNEGLRARLCALGESRVLTLPGEQIADEPESAVRAVAIHFGLPISQGLPKSMFSDTTAGRHAKDPSRSYDARSRRKELKTLQKHIGAEADRGVEWAVKHGVLFGGRL